MILPWRGLSDTEILLCGSGKHTDIHKKVNWDTKLLPAGACSNMALWQAALGQSSPVPLVSPLLSLFSFLRMKRFHFHCSIDGKGGLSEQKPSTVCSLQFGVEITWNSLSPPLACHATPPSSPFKVPWRLLQKQWAFSQPAWPWGSHRRRWKYHHPIWGSRESL